MRVSSHFMQGGLGTQRVQIKGVFPQLVRWVRDLEIVCNYGNRSKLS
jgi:hypothetical protein